MNRSFAVTIQPYSGHTERRPRRLGASGVRKCSINFSSGFKTSVSMEPLYWSEFKLIAARRNQPIRKLVEEIERERTTGNLSAAIRTFVLADALARAGKAEAVQS
jgi:predicted DNA-binding ribbon-helix-helix protein